MEERLSKYPWREHLKHQMQLAVFHACEHRFVHAKYPSRHCSVVQCSNLVGAKQLKACKRCLYLHLLVCCTDLWLSESGSDQHPESDEDLESSASRSVASNSGSNITISVASTITSTNSIPAASSNYSMNARVVASTRTCAKSVPLVHSMLQPIALQCHRFHRLPQFAIVITSLWVY